MTAHEFEIMVQRHLDGLADDISLQRLQTNQSLWIETLFRLLEQTEKSIASVRRRYRGIERRTVLDDLNSEADRIDKVLTEILGPAPSQEVMNTDVEEDTSKAEMQLAWRDGRLIAWLGAHKSQSFGHETILDNLGRIESSRN